MNRHAIPLWFGATEPSDYTEHVFDAEEREAVEAAEKDRREQESEE
jgi:hypothetical protein